MADVCFPCNGPRVSGNLGRIGKEGRRPDCSYGPFWLHTAQKYAPPPLHWRLGVRAVVAAHSTETCTSATTLAAEGTNRRGYIQHRNPYPRPYIGGCGHGTLGLRTSPNFPLPKAAGQKKKPHKAIDFPLLFRYDNLTAIFSSLCGSFSTKFPPCIFPLKRL